MIDVSAAGRDPLLPDALPPGPGHDPSRHAGFAAEWPKALREDPREIYQAAYSAQRVSRYVTARMPEMEPAGRDTGPALPVPEREAGRGR